MFVDGKWFIAKLKVLDFQIFYNLTMKKGDIKHNKRNVYNELIIPRHQTPGPIKPKLQVHRNPPT